MKTVTTAPGLALTSPAVERNRGPILDVLRKTIREDAEVLEVASGTGEHAVWFCRALPHVRWQPTDRDHGTLDSIAAWRERAGLPNLLPPLMLDAASPKAWAIQDVDAIVAINLTHISPWSATVGLMRGASESLRADGLLFVYGAFLEETVPTAESNLVFDANLRGRNPAWGLRQLGAVCREAERFGLMLRERVEMPARNLGLVFRRGT